METTKGIEWKPNPGPQTWAYESEADELFYGGAAGGGKTDLIIGLALTMMRHSIIFRVEKENLSPIRDRMDEVLGDLGSFNSGMGRYVLPGGKRVDLAGCRNDKSLFKFQGRPSDGRLFDELPQITEKRYLFLTGWTRSAKKDLDGQKRRTRIVGTGNPPMNPEERWVVKRWGAWLDPDHRKPAKPGELRWYIRVDDKDTEVEPDFEFELPDGGSILASQVGEEALILDARRLPRMRSADGSLLVGKVCPVLRVEGGRERKFFPRSRTFIPAYLTDNPYLSGTDYEGVIDSMPEPLRTMLRDGDFQVGMQDHEWQLFPADWIRKAQARWEPRAPGEKGLITSIGVDVARGGTAKTVVCRKHDGWVDEFKEKPGIQTKDGPLAALFVTEWIVGTPTIVVDVDGVGGACADALRGMEPPEAGWKLWEFHGNGKSEYRDRSGRLKMVNARTAAHWMLMELLDPDGPNPISLPPSDDLFDDLVAIRWEVTMQGVRLLKKEKLEEVSGRGFHHSDALAYAVWGDGSSMEVATGVEYDKLRGRIEERNADIPDGFEPIL